ncbi:transcriptional regulator [Aciduliprofundum sp. MAR08-339]|uniref:Lrp/AsnC family transcriptional regulator n=1 Tax=Aciduliprofundum sp. (strain MAR08-339) TaxID=673860 RepID=UPI0002A47E71|nr:transcriptional regulator [Aciduliprofundum sp. MAR08-339]
MDDRDRKIVELLLKDSRMSYSKIANILGISDTAVRKRIKNLEKEGVIRGYTVCVDPHSLGYKCVAILGIDTESDRFYKVAETLKNMKEVRCVDMTSGENMIVVEIWAENGEDLAKLISERIGKIDGVKKVKSSVVLQKLKG